MIVGRDLLQELSIVLHFGDLRIAWEHAITPMKNHDLIENNDIVAIDSKSPAISDATDQMKQILKQNMKQLTSRMLLLNVKIYLPQNKNSCLLFSPDSNHCSMEHLDIGKMRHMTSH
jgi:hypothetical protein